MLPIKVKSHAKIKPASRRNGRFEFYKSRQVFISVNTEPLLVAMRICNEDYLTVAIGAEPLNEIDTDDLCKIWALLRS